MSFVPLSELPCVDTISIGGAQQAIFAIPIRDVQGDVTPDSDGIVSDAVPIAGGSTFTKYNLDADSVRFRERQVNGEHGTYFEYTLEGFRSRMESAHQQEISKLSTGLYMVQCRDNNNFPRLLGTKDRPMRFTSEGDTGANTRGQNRVAWRFYGVSKAPAAYLPVAAVLPSEQALPVAVLALSQAFCGNVNISAQGSYLVDGTVISALTPSTSCVLEFLIGAFSIIYKVRIAPDADPSVIGNWTILQGNAASFETTIVDQVASGGSGFSWSFDGAAYAAAFGNFMNFSLTVVEDTVISSNALGTQGTKSLTYTEGGNRSFDCSFDQSFS